MFLNYKKHCKTINYLHKTKTESNTDSILINMKYFYFYVFKLQLQYFLYLKLYETLVVQKMSLKRKALEIKC